MHPFLKPSPLSKILILNVWWNGLFEGMKLSLPLCFIYKFIFFFLVDFFLSNIVSSLKNTQKNEKNETICICNCTFPWTVIQIIKPPRKIMATRLAASFLMTIVKLSMQHPHMVTVFEATKIALCLTAIKVPGSWEYLQYSFLLLIVLQELTLQPLCSVPFMFQSGANTKL